MWFWKVTPMAACLCVLTAVSGSAQSVQVDSARDSTRDSARTAAPSSKSLSITGAYTKADRLDAVASPRPFDGSGVSGGLSYRATSPRWMFQTSLDGATANYLPNSGAATATERAYSGSLGAGLTRWITSQPNRSFGVGVSLNSWAEVLEHQYADPNQTTASFMTGFATLGPSATFRQLIGGGEASISASVPLVGVVHQPYADLRQEHGPITFNAAGPAQLRGFDVGLRYETSVNSRMGLVVEHRLRNFDYTGGWNTNSLTNTTSLGVVIRLGRKPGQ